MVILLGKSAWGVISVLLTMISTLPYMHSMLKGQTRPHVFSWVIWCLACAIIAAAQYSTNAGPGYWATLTSAVISLLIVLICFRQKSDWGITRSDWVAFTGSLAIIPLWYITQNALIAAVLATLIDSLAYYPTFRKSYYKPHQEMAFLYFVANLKHIASIFAMAHYSITALVMPVTMLGINAGLIIMLLMRRKNLAFESETK